MVWDLFSKINCRPFRWNIEINFCVAEEHASKLKSLIEMMVMILNKVLIVEDDPW